jgi:hypothetical protein
MIKQLTRVQERRLENDLEALKSDDDYDLTIQDILLEVFLPAKIGIVKNGFDVPEIMKIIGISKKDYKTLCQTRTSVCQFVQSLVKQGYAMGGIKTKGNLKKYGWATQQEFEQIEFDRKERCAKEISNTLHYLDDDDKLTFMGKSFLKEIDKQLQLFNDKK